VRGGDKGLVSIAKVHNRKEMQIVLGILVVSSGSGKSNTALGNGGGISYMVERKVGGQGNAKVLCIRGGSGETVKGSSKRGGEGTKYAVGGGGGMGNKIGM